MVVHALPKDFLECSFASSLLLMKETQLRYFTLVVNEDQPETLCGPYGIVAGRGFQIMLDTQHSRSVVNVLPSSTRAGLPFRFEGEGRLGSFVRVDLMLLEGPVSAFFALHRLSSGGPLLGALQPFGDLS